MAKLTFLQKAEISESASFQKRLQIALQERAIYWLKTTNDPLLIKVAGTKYKALADGIFYNRVPTNNQRTYLQAAICFLAAYVDANPVLDQDGTPSDSVLSGQSADGQYYFDAYFRDWAGVTYTDEITNN